MNDQVKHKLQNNAISGAHMPVDTELADVTGAETLLQGSDAAVDMVESDEFYHALRNAIGVRVTAALVSGLHLVQEKPHYEQLTNYGPFNFDDFRLSLPKHAHQHYNCSHCRSVWAQMAGLAVMDDNGAIIYPVVEGLKDVAETGLPLAVKLLAELESRPKQRATIMPVSSLTSTLVENDVGGWTHFYGTSAKAHIRHFNESLTPVYDFKYVQDWFQRFVTNELNTDLLSKIFTFIEAKIGKKEHTALVHGHRLVQLIIDTRRVQKESGRGLLWLWSTMQKRKNNWMRHINGSCLGIVLDGERECKTDPSKMEKVLMNVKNLLAQATSGENYKNKTAPSSEASFDQAVAFLEERGLKNTMRRRLMRIDEVQSVVWSAEDAFKPKSDFEAPVPEGYDPVEQAISGIKVEKNKDLSASAKMDEVLGNVSVAVSMSAMAFLAELPNFENLRLSRLNIAAIAGFCTTAVTEGDHAQLLTFDEEVGPFASTLNTPQPMAYSVFCQVATDESIVHPTRDLVVSAILSSNRIPGSEPNYLVHIEGFAGRFVKGIQHFGTAILGSSIRSDHFGMSRALCELSKRIPMEGVDAEKAVGGAMLRQGMIFEATLKNGTKQTITLTSWK